MTITNDMRLAALKRSSETVREMHSSMETADILTVLEKQYSLPSDGFIELVGDIILGFYPKSQLRSLLQAHLGLTEEVAAHIEQDLKGLLFKIDGVPIVPPASKEVQEPLVRRPEESGFLAGAKPLTREEVLRSLAPKRTMATDIESVRQAKGGETPGGASRP